MKLDSSEERLTAGPWITDKQALNHFPADSSKQLSQYNTKQIFYHNKVQTTSQKQKKHLFVITMF